MYAPKEGECVEVEILDPGFEGSRWEAVVRSVNLEKKTAVVEFAELLSDDNSGKLKEERDFEHIWPVPKNDWDMPLSERHVGDPVDCWSEDGWWQGVVYIACNDGLLVYFPLTPGSPDMKAVTPETVSKCAERVRTGADWDAETSQWVPRPIQVYEGNRDYRKKLLPKREKVQDDHWTDDETEENTCQEFFVDDFVQKRVPYPYELEREQKMTRRERRKRSQQENGEDNDEDVKLVLISSTRVIPSAASSYIETDQSGLQTRGAVNKGTSASNTPNPTAQEIVSGTLPSGLDRPSMNESHRTEKPRRNRAVLSPKAQKTSKTKQSLGKPDMAGKLDRTDMPVSQKVDRRKKKAGSVAEKPNALSSGKKVSLKRAREDTSLEVEKDIKHSRKQCESIGKGNTRRTNGQEKAQNNVTSRQGAIHRSSHSQASKDVVLSVSEVEDSQQIQHKASRSLNKPLLGIDNGYHKIEAVGWKQILYKRTKLMGRFAGCCMGPKVCVDGLGWAYDEDVVARSLKEKLSGVSRVDFASGMLFGSRRRYSSGYACITFNSIEYAVRGLVELDSYYLCIPGCPVARPLIAHFPMWSSSPWGMDDVPGRVPLESGVVPPHFCQMNTIEFDSGVEWRHLRQVQVSAKKALCKSYIEEITKVIDDHREGLVAPDRKVYKKPHSLGVKQTLWLKAVPRTMSDDYIRSVFEQFDECCKVHRLIDPVTQGEAGHILIDFEDVKKAGDVCSDMNTYLYLAGGTPRPLDVQIFDQGGPAGFEAVLDCAIKESFNVDMAEFSQDMIGHVCLRKIDTNDSARKRCSRAIRAIMERMAHDRAALFLKNQAEQLELHNTHAKYFASELHHFRVLNEAMEASRKGVETSR